MVNLLVNAPLLILKSRNRNHVIKCLKIANSIILLETTYLQLLYKRFNFYIISILYIICGMKPNLIKFQCVSDYKYYILRNIDSARSVHPNNINNIIAW